ncbi:MAG: lipase family protein [Cellvibrionaceae bacterium]
MDTLPPKKSAEFAAGIYAVRNEFIFKKFLEQSEFSQKGGDKNTVSASLGGRLFNTKNSFGLCVRGAGNYKNDIFLIFRGTATSADIISNIRAGFQASMTGSFVHSGFNQAFTSMIRDISAFLSLHSDATNVHCIGHSLGGAVANLAADWVKDSYSKNVKLYTFGSPRVGLGLGGFANSLTTKLKEENIHRVYHGNDPVPMFPVFPYMHAPQPKDGYYLSFNGRLMSIQAHFMKNYISTVSESRWESMSSFSSGLPSYASLKNWLTADIRVSLNDAGAWEKINHIFRYLFQSVLATVFQPILVGGLTAIDQLAMMLHRGIDFSVDAADWVFYLIRRMMQMMGMKIVESFEQLTEALIRMIAYISQEVKKAIDSIL